MAASDEHPKHGEVLDEVLRDEIKAPLIGGLPFVLHPEISGSERIL